MMIWISRQIMWIWISRQMMWIWISRQMMCWWRRQTGGSIGHQFSIGMAVGAATILLISRSHHPDLNLKKKNRQLKSFPAQKFMSNWLAIEIYLHSSEIRGLYAWWNDPSKCFKIFQIFGIWKLTQFVFHFIVVNDKNYYVWFFVFQKYGQFWRIAVFRWDISSSINILFLKSAWLDWSNQDHWILNFW